MKVLKAAAQFTVTTIVTLFLLPAIPIRANQPIRTLGNDSLGETVKQFQIHHPKATVRDNHFPRYKSSDFGSVGKHGRRALLSE